MASGSSSPAVQVSKIDTIFEKTAAAAKQPRVRVSTDLEEKVKRCLRDHFRGWSSELVHGVEIDNLSLYNRLMRDKALWVVDKALCPMGAPYFDSLRSKYGGGATIETLLQVNDGQQVSSEMRQAATEAFMKLAKRSRMLQWLACTTQANQAEMVGACRWVCRLRPSVAEQLHCCVEVMRFICRLELHTKYEKEAKLMLPKFEEVLLQAT